MKTHALQKRVVCLFSVPAILVFSILLFAETGQPSAAKLQTDPQQTPDVLNQEIRRRVDEREFHAKKIK